MASWFADRFVKFYCRKLQRNVVTLAVLNFMIKRYSRQAEIEIILTGGTATKETKIVIKNVDGELKVCKY